MIIVIDTREQKPWDFPNDLTVVRGSLPTGDYSPLGYHHLVAIERKAPMDYIGSLTQGRERFMAEVARLSLIPYSAIIVESDFETVINPKVYTHKQRISSSHIVGGTSSIMTRFQVPVVFCTNRTNAKAFALRYMRHAVEEIATKGIFAALNRIVEASSCVVCGKVAHEAARDGTLQLWRPVVDKQGQFAAVCGGDGCVKPKNYRWSDYGRGMVRVVADKGKDQPDTKDAASRSRPPRHRGRRHSKRKKTS